MKTAVAIALYNGERFIEKQLDSLRTQTQTPDQVVMCDDGSKDKTVEIVKRYIKQYNLEEKWQIIENEKNLGYIKNFYHAISLCDADLIFLSDQDDIWADDKIAKMTEVMKQRTDIELLSCKYGIIDANGEQISSIMERRSKEDYSINEVSVQDVMRAYRWPGMVLCLRKQFFNSIIEHIEEHSIPHDLAFIICAADKKGFYEYNYIGAFHRRHDNNVAREEHRVSKLLNLNRKLRDISEMCGTLQNIIKADLPLEKESDEFVNYKLQLLCKRKIALEDRSLKDVIKLYKDDSGKILRTASLVCDLWLVFFGKCE